jgi:hypothetical protein
MRAPLRHATERAANEGAGTRTTMTMRRIESEERRAGMTRRRRIESDESGERNENAQRRRTRKKEGVY